MTCSSPARRRRQNRRRPAAAADGSTAENPEAGHEDDRSERPEPIRVRTCADRAAAGAPARARREVARPRDAREPDQGRRKATRHAHRGAEGTRRQGRRDDRAHQEHRRHVRVDGPEGGRARSRPLGPEDARGARRSDQSGGGRGTHFRRMDATTQTLVPSNENVRFLSVFAFIMPSSPVAASRQQRAAQRIRVSTHFACAIAGGSFSTAARKVSISWCV